MNNRRDRLLLLLLCGALAACATPARAGDQPAKASATSGSPWKFVVAGDSRNCGDVVMPAVAAGVKSAGAAFYWHLGDFRALHDFDEDIVAARKVAGDKPLAVIDYQRT